MLGNSIRCLLSAFWWKQLFNCIADRIEEVEQKVDSKSGVVTVGSEDDLNKLDLSKGSLASVIGAGMKFSQCYRPSEEEITDQSVYYKLTRVKNIDIREAMYEVGELGVACLVGENANQTYASIGIGNVNGKTIINASLSANGEVLFNGQIVSDGQLSQFNKLLSQYDFRYLKTLDNGTPEDQQLATLDKSMLINIDSSVYLKGGFWEKLKKEAEGSDVNSVLFYAPVLGTLSPDYVKHNADAYQRVVDAKGVIDIKIDYMFLRATAILVAFSDDNSLRLAMSDTNNPHQIIVSPDGNTTMEDMPSDIPEQITVRFPLTLEGALFQSHGTFSELVYENEVEKFVKALYGEPAALEYKNAVSSAIQHNKELWQKLPALVDGNRPIRAYLDGSSFYDAAATEQNRKGLVNFECSIGISINEDQSVAFVEFSNESLIPFRKMKLLETGEIQFIGPNKVYAPIEGNVLLDTYKAFNKRFASELDEGISDTGTHDITVGLMNSSNSLIGGSKLLYVKDETLEVVGIFMTPDGTYKLSILKSDGETTVTAL